MKKFNIARRAILRACLRALAFGLLMAAHGEINVPASDAMRQSPPPQAMPAEVRVRIGGTVEIPLRVYGNETQVVKFKLKSQTKFGKLSEPRMVDKNTAAVTYRHSGNASQMSDKFSYNVQATNGVSVPAEVKITVFDDPPILAVPDEINFGNVLVGSPPEREVTIANQGGGIIEGTIEAPANWKVEGNANYRLRRGETATLRIACVPREEMALRGDLKYTSHTDRVTTLRASAQMPIVATPQSLELKTGKGDSQRAGALQISNRTGAPVPIRLIASKRLELAERVTVPAGGGLSVPITISRDDLEPINEEIRAEAANLSMPIAVHATAVGPIIRANPAQLSLGSMPFEKPAGATLTIENIGGMPGFVRIEVPPPFAIAREDAAFPLDSRAKRDVRVTIQPVEAGRFRAPLAIKSQEDSVELPVEAEVRNRSAALAQSASEPAVISQISNETAEPLPTSIPLPVSSIPGVQRAVLKNVTRSSATFEWQAPSNDRLQYKLEAGQLSADSSDDLKVRWIPLTNVTFDQTGNTVSAVLNKLTPGVPYAVRIVTMNQQGEMSPFTWEINFMTRPPLGLFTPVKMLFAVFAVLLALILRQRFVPKRGASRNPQL